MSHLEVFDPPLCCSSGVCGPSVDPLLAAFAADVDWLVGQGVTVTRHNLAQEPPAFVAEPLVRDALQRDGNTCLPLLVLDGAIVARGAYPRRDELARLAGLAPAASTTKPKIRLASACGCKADSGCC
jgi:arsenical resistance operon trans-acting repressor ArsD